MTSACIATGVHFTATHSITALELPPRVYAVALIMAVFSTVIPGLFAERGHAPHRCQFHLDHQLHGPVIALYLAYVLLGETVSTARFAGTALVIVGIWWATGRGRG